MEVIGLGARTFSATNQGALAFARAIRCLGIAVFLLELSCNGKAPRSLNSTSSKSPELQEKTPASFDAAKAVKPAFRRFVMSSFHWELRGNDVLLVHDDGTLEYVSPSVEKRVQKKKPRVYYEPVWHHVQSTLDSSKFDELLRALDEVEVDKLESSYVNHDIHDGISVDFFFGNSQGEKRVHCGNEFPDSIQKLRVFLREKIIPSSEEVKRAPAMTRSEAKTFWERFR